MPVLRPHGAKYPLMSTIISVASLTKMLIPPPIPAGTIAAFATTVPLQSFSVDTIGSGCPAGQTVTHPNAAGGSAVMFSEYACAATGTLHVLCGNGIDR